MSRRAPNPAAERAAQNQQTIKSLLKLEPNKICADCKRNKHPRWASWNLGVFICIRCSGIHRGMGTHISRVKSVDLDSWTDEQLASILSWGNARANKYWESKLAAQHVPSEAKIENFIRTKYELKRWVMDGGIPDPATLDAEADDDIPLSIVKEKQTIERKESIRKSSVGQTSGSPVPALGRGVAGPGPAAPQPDLIGGDPIPQRASTTGPALSKVPPKGEPAPPKTTSTKDSLLGLDFLGTEPSVPPRPSSTTGTGGAGGQSRPDLKQSILSLYATAPRPQQQQQPSHSHSGSFSSMPSSPPPPQQNSMGGGGFGGMNDAFSSLSFSNTTSSKSPPVDAFASLGSFSSSRSPPPAQKPTTNSSAFSGLGGGSFFDAKPAPAPLSQPQNQSSFGSTSNGGFDAFGGLGSLSSPTLSSPAPKPAAAPVPASSAMGDLFDLAAPAPAAPPKPAPAAANSVFNLSASQAAMSPPAAPAATTPATSVPNPMASTNWANSDVWGGNEWSTAETAAAAKPSTNTTSTFGASSGAFGGGAWGGSTGGGLASQSIVPGASGGLSIGGGLSGQSIVPGASGGFAPQVAADEEFGGWTSMTSPSAAGTTAGGTAKPTGGNDDLFSNVWQ